MSSVYFKTSPYFLSRELSPVLIARASSIQYGSNANVINMKQEYFGGNYNVQAVSRFDYPRKDTQQAIPGDFGVLTVTIKFADSPLYVRIIINSVLSDSPSYQRMIGLVSVEAPQSTSSSVAVSDSGRHSLTANVVYGDNNTNISFYLYEVLTNNDDPNRCLFEMLVQQNSSTSISSKYIEPVTESTQTNAKVLVSGDILITINAETDTFLGRNLGQVYFEIRDDRAYYPNQGTAIGDTYVLTQFTQYPDLTQVIIGKGENLIDKLTYIAQSQGIPVAPLLGKVVAYGMLRLFLARLMYGSFKLYYLTGKFTPTFFRDLANSRYRDFMQAFEDSSIRGASIYYKDCIPV